MVKTRGKSSIQGNKTVQHHFPVPAKVHSSSLSAWSMRCIIGLENEVDKSRKEANLKWQRNWNQPVREEGSGAQSATSDQPMSEPSTAADVYTQDPGPPPFEVSAREIQRSSIEGARVQPIVHDPGSSRLSGPDDESFAVPQHSSVSAPRMIQQSSGGRGSVQNAFKRLRHMGSSIGDGSEKLSALPPPGDLGQYGYPTTKTAEKKPETRYPGYKAYRVTRCMCGFTTFVSVLLAACAIASILLAIFKMDKDCSSVGIMLVLMDIILLVIVTLEWIRQWLWREPMPLSSRRPSAAKHKLNVEASMGPIHAGGGLPMMYLAPGPIANSTYPSMNPSDNQNGGFLTLGFQQRIYDVPQFVSALCLVILYATGTICICGTMAAAGIHHKECTELSMCAIGLGAICALLVCMRIVMCCMSDACRGLCHRTTAMNSATPVPMAAVNQLHQVLPGMGRSWHAGGESQGGAQPTAWLMNLASASDPRQQLSIIQPMPVRYANDLTH